ncbi:hypothetical protein SCOCK_770019 [Actinacidiphila cocklensis]|uniref:Uncharacterized protein n=1 Tax=Actinacidiphila cocklensis TaxID=887465 RepID=A0A9W4DZ32_9ACTN|nr:hypothetical protein SCOCK_770019 [Actinacidiphila cocklensis]
MVQRALRAVGQRPRDLHLRRPHLRPLAAQHAAVRTARRGWRHLPRGARRLRSGQVRLRRAAGGLRRGHRRGRGARRGTRGADLPDVQQDRPDRHPLGGDHPLADLAVRPVPDVGVRRGGDPGGTAGGRPHGRRRGDQDVLPDQPAAAGSRHRHRAAVHHGRHLEQLLPAADHDQEPALVPAHPGPELVEPAGRDRRRPAGVPPGDHRLAAHHRPADRGLPAAPAVLAVRPGRRKRQGVKDRHRPPVPPPSARPLTGRTPCGSALSTHHHAQRSDTR